MNTKTLNKQFAAQFYEEGKTYEDLTKRWKLIISNKKPLLVEDYILYAILRGKNWRKTATPPTNPIKLENGALTGWCVRFAISRISAGSTNQYTNLLLEPYKDIIKKETLDIIKQILPSFYFKLSDDPYIIKKEILDA